VDFVDGGSDFVGGSIGLPELVGGGEATDVSVGSLAEVKPLDCVLDGSGCGSTVFCGSPGLSEAVEGAEGTTGVGMGPLPEDKAVDFMTGGPEFVGRSLGLTELAGGGEVTDVSVGSIAELKPLDCVSDGSG
jgi:hypothetical protein